MEENQYQLKLYGFFQTFIYIYIFIDSYVNLLSFAYNHNPVIRQLNQKLYQIPFLVNPVISHLVLFVFIIVISLAAKARKNINFSVYRHFVYPFLAGFLFYVISGFLFVEFGSNVSNVISFSPSGPKDSGLIRRGARGGLGQGWAVGCIIASYLLGALLIQVAFSNLTKHFKNNLKKDVWNVEEESFDQNKVLVQNEYLFNVPMQFYYRKKIHQGWMNINPFRGVMVLGVPGSGKSESIIIPFIKQFLARGFAMLVYDFKYPTLAQLTYYHYLKNQKTGALKDHKFHVINLDDIEYSQRINPLDTRYIRSLADAGETAEAIVTALKKGDRPSGNEQFFTQSAINFLSASIYFLAKYQNGQYSTLPHLLAFVGLPYEKIFQHLFSMVELHSLLAPFSSAYTNKAFEQLEGQIGSVRINISRLATKETFWVFGANDFDLKISNPPSVLVLANSPDSQNINSAFFASILLRVIRLVNNPGNNPCALVVDELPTLYLHKLDNLIATARSNKVAVMLGLQDLSQLQQQQGKETASTISSLMGSVISGAVRSKDTLDWLEKLFGRIKQTSQGLNIDRSKTGVNINERLDNLIPASKIANQNTGEVVAMVSRDNVETYGNYQTNTFKCKVTLDFKQINAEKAQYPSMPKFYDFGEAAERERFLLENLRRVYRDVESI